MTPNQIQQRLLQLPEQHRDASRELIAAYNKHLTSKINLQTRHAQVLSDGLSSGSISGKNAETRDAELRVLLANDTDYNYWSEEGLTAETQLKDLDLTIRNLEFESNILLTVYRTVSQEECLSEANRLHELGESMVKESREIKAVIEKLQAATNKPKRSKKKEEVLA